MKVICINNKPIQRRFNMYGHLLVEGNTYTVVEKCPVVLVDGSPSWGYVLREIHLPGSAFEVRRFIPVSDIDETEMIREFQTEKV